MSFKSILVTTLVPLAALGATVGISRPTLAHNVETNYVLSSQNELEIQVMFSTGEPFESAPVQIYSPDNFETPILEGSTDEEGRFAFEADTSVDAGEWKMKIGELGHGDILLVPVDEEGIDIDMVSSAVHSPGQSSNNGHYWAVGLGLLSAGVLAKAIDARR